RKAQPGMKATYTGVEAEDAYLFGCGMDYREYWRNAPGLFAVEGL
ncbi:MAG: hypoxanthine-guanine phosphoribosyltransferase, partial [Alcanivoracaceae bacterium]|nr:hypoxanthine-guanine phosphoribosyltransferase [Alcanivoracaceae bacterium]